MAALRQPFRAQMQLLVGAGMRLGETEALRVCDLSFSAASERQTRVRDAKTEAGVRSVFVPTWTANAVAAHIQEHDLSGEDPIVVALAANGLPARTDPTPAVPSGQRLQPTSEPTAPRDGLPSQPDLSDRPQEAHAPVTAERAQREAPSPVPDRMRFRRRSRNRYPGPIPTPAEWEPPEGPVRIALQAGHWRAEEAPRELRGLRDNGTAWEGGVAPEGHPIS